MLNWAWNRYKLPIYVTENGISIPNENNIAFPEVLNDTFRIHYYEGYLNAMLDAVTIDGVQVLGYMAWSLLEYISLFLSSLCHSLFPDFPLWLLRKICFSRLVFFQSILFIWACMWEIQYYFGL